MGWMDERKEGGGWSSVRVSGCMLNRRRKVDRVCKYVDAFMDWIKFAGCACLGKEKGKGKGSG